MTSYIPMPRTYLTYDTTNIVKDFYSWYVEGIGPYDMIDSRISYARQKEVEDFIDAHKDVFSEELYGLPCYNHAMKLLHPELKDAYRLYRHNYYQAKSYQKHKYGIIGWLDWCRTNYGCTWPAPFDVWRLYKETGDNLCLAIEMNVCALIPDVFLRYMNSIDGLTVYAYGNDNEEYEFWYQFNGQNNEITKKNPWKDRNYKKYLKEFEKAEEDLSKAWIPFSDIVRILQSTLTLKEENGEKILDLLIKILEEENCDRGLIMNIVYGNSCSRKDSLLCWIENNTSLSEKLDRILNFYMKL